MSKSSYREYFANVRLYIIMKPFLQKAGITNSNFSYFMKGPEYDFLISVEKLNSLKNALQEVIYEIV